MDKRAGHLANLQSLAIVLVDLENLLILRKTPPARPATQSISKNIKSKSSLPIFDKYNKDRYWGIRRERRGCVLKILQLLLCISKEIRFS
ncbi:hypothetical protein DFH11DRAFT_1033437 [Phellopilus nigrolimitatus]|nr:hypothetical protein DFH11DRAFT_1033437 [Phellopilus nigrolimitatus]